MDLILGDADMAIEVKASKDATGRTKGPHLFLDGFPCKKVFIVSKDPVPRKLGSQITILPWQVFCQKLWDGQII